MTEGHFPDEGMVDFDTEQDVPLTSERSDDVGGPSVATPHDDHSGEGEAAPAAEPDPKVAELTSDLQRLQAEYVNYKRRVDRDRELVLQNARFSVLSSLLPVLDAIDRARQHGELEGGFKAVAESLERIVEGQGLLKFGAPGDEFDPTRHEALMHGHSPDVTTSTAQNIIQSGYTIGDRVVRPAQVTVVDPEPAPADPEPADLAAEDADEGKPEDE